MRLNTWLSKTIGLLMAWLLIHCGGGEPHRAMIHTTLVGAPSGRFTPAGTLQQSHAVHTATLLGNGRVLIAGGQSRPFTTRVTEPRAELEIYDPGARTFTSAGRMSRERALHTATLLDDGTVLLAGGVTVGPRQGTDSLDSAELFDAAAGTVSLLGAALQQPQQAHTATRLPDGRVLIVGGFDGVRGGGYLDTAELYDPGEQRFTRVAARMVRPRQLHTATLLTSGKVLIVGGFGLGGAVADAELYDPATGLFTLAGRLQVARALHQATLLESGQVLISGGAGANSLASCELYDPLRNVFLSTGGMSVPRQLHSATRLPSGLVLVAGGTPDSASTRADGSAELYDPLTGQFRPAPALLAARQRHTATLLDSGAVLLAGGHDAANVLTAELYEPATVIVSVLPAMATVAVGATLTFTARVIGAADRSVIWSASAGSITAAGVYTPPAVPGTYVVTATSVAAPSESGATRVTVVAGPGALLEAHSAHTETLLVDGRVLIVGGASSPFTRNAQPVQGMVDVYDPRRGSFAATAPLLTPRSLHSATRLGDGTVLVAGGFDGSHSLASAELFEPGDPTGLVTPDRWVALGSMMVTRRGHSATALGDGRVLIVGGYASSGAGGSGGGLLDSAELYDPVTRRFTALPYRLQARRQLHTATLLANGQVLIAGGIRDSGALTSAELYDPVSQRFVATGSLRTGRFLHRETRLVNGRVLLTGGAGPGSLADCELYDPTTGLFAATPPRMHTPRQLHTATPLADGRVLVTGGSPESESLAALGSVEVYDPVKNRFAVLPTLAYARERHTATLLASGQVLIAGGHAAANVLAAELYVPPPAPVLEEVSPARAPNTGGVTITLRGRFFVVGATVTVDGDPASNVVVISSSEIRFTLPARPGVRGLVEVTVTNPDEQSACRADLFGYTAVGGPIRFAAVGSVAVASEPQALASGDFGGDGLADVATVSTVADAVSVLGGDGQGGFGPAMTLALGANPVFAVAGDFNGDRASDLAVASYGDYSVPSGSAISVLLGQVGQAGALQVAGRVALDAAPRSLAVGDFNGDGILDLVAAHDLEDRISVFIGQGDGRFSVGALVPVRPSPWALATGDFDGDGRLDLAVAHSAVNEVSVLLGRGDGTFGPGQTVDAGPLPVSLATGDIDSDGLLDVVVADGLGAEVRVLLGNGNGTLRAAGGHAVGEEPQAVAVADFNGDGNLDVAVATYGSQEVSMLGGNGEGSFQPVASFAAGLRPVALVAVDLNGDGRLDLAVANEGTGDVSVLLNTSSLNAPNARTKGTPGMHSQATRTLGGAKPSGT